MDEIKEKNKFRQLLQAKWMKKYFPSWKKDKVATPTMFFQGAIFLRKKGATSREKGTKLPCGAISFEENFLNV
jgi:hypothetical protein